MVVLKIVVRWNSGRGARMGRPPSSPPSFPPATIPPPAKKDEHAPLCSDSEHRSQTSNAALVLPRRDPFVLSDVACGEG